MAAKSPFSDFIHQWPHADIAFEGVEARLLAGEVGQAVFFCLPAGASVPPHSHGAQWGIVVQGELTLTIGGVARTYKKGDTYQIGDGEVHSGEITSDCWVIDVFADPGRYRARE
ncbi:MAG: cupin domain-containing protein [Deltaproteobacteria bacterium]|nr:cupin domain-containing protein [Deltaproteobacteria bacterium]